MQILNLTPHPIKIGKRVIHQTGEPIRVNQIDQLLYTVDHIPVKMIVHTEPDISVLPEMLPQTIYIVSRLVADVYRDIREDFCFPYEFSRTPDGRILGCRSLAKFEPAVS